MAAVQEENLAAEAPPAAEVKDEAAGVGVLGWLGFVIINLAIWGIVSVATALSWVFGFVVLLVYFGVLLGMALCMRKLGPRFESFQNLLWVLACTAIFFIGLYFSINVIGDLANEQNNNLVDHTLQTASTIPTSVPMIDFLPENSSEELKTYVGTRIYGRENLPTYAEYQGFTFLGGMSPSFMDVFVYGKNIAIRSDGTASVRLSPVLQTPRCFVEYNSQLYFLAKNGSSSMSGIWTIDAASATSASPLAVYVGVWNGNLAELTVLDGKLWVKTNYLCGTGYNSMYVDTVYSYDGTTVSDIRGDKCGGHSAPEDPTDPDPWNPTVERPVAEMWGTIFLGIVPMMIVAAVVLWKIKMQGMFFNLYCGFGGMVAILYNIATEENVPTFFKWFFTLYAAIAYIILTGYCLLKEELSPFAEKLKDWIVVIVGLLFFGMIHIDLEIPATDAAGSWVLYAILAGVQFVISIIVLRTLPFVLGALSTFVIAWKIAREIAAAIFSNGQFFSSEETLAMLAIVALQGIAIIAGAVVYAANRDKVDSTVRTGLRRCLRLGQK